MTITRQPKKIINKKTGLGLGESPPKPTMVPFYKLLLDENNGNMDFLLCFVFFGVRKRNTAGQNDRE